MSAYLDGELAAGRRARLERHVRDCDDCRRLLAGLRAVLAALHRLAALGTSADASRIAASVRVRMDAPPAP